MFWIKIYENSHIYFIFEKRFLRKLAIIPNLPVMTINKYVNRLRQINQLIRQQRTGSPKQLAETLGISERQVYNSVDYLRDKEVPISYCRIRKTYYYSESVDLRISFSLVNLSTQETKEIDGGKNNMQIFLPLQCHCSGVFYF